MHNLPMQRPHENTYWVEPNRLLAGEYPASVQAQLAPDRLQDYLDCGITDFIDLTTPGELDPYQGLLEDLARRRELEIGYWRQPIVDRSVPESPQVMTRILDEIDRRIESGGTVYVHCWGGVGRTGMVVGCHLVRQGLTGDAALAELARLWPQMEKSGWYETTPQTPEQFDYVRNWREP